MARFFFFAKRSFQNHKIKPFRQFNCENGINLPTLFAEPKKPKKLESFRIAIPSFVIAPAKIAFDGSSLTVTRDRKKFTRKLSPEEIAKIQNAIQLAPLDKWSQFWLNDGYLDGYIIFANFTISGKEYHFEGMNGCPPGFGKLADTLNSITGKLGHIEHWAEAEANSQQIEGTYKSWGESLKKKIEEKVKKDEERARKEKEALKQERQKTKRPD